MACAARRLRGKAKQQLGARYGVRDFNDAVIRAGAVPLTVLGEAIIRSYTRRRPRAFWNAAMFVAVVP